MWICVFQTPRFLPVKADESRVDSNMNLGQAWDVNDYDVLVIAGQCMDGD